MATQQELIQQIESILYSGTESVAHNNRQLRYRSVDDLLKLLQRLQSANQTTQRQAFTALYAQTGTGL